jgi:hypothetical protein
MAELNWALFVSGMVVGGLLSYSVCELIFPVQKK